MSAGIVNTGGASFVIVTEELAVFPLESVTVAVIVCVPYVRGFVRNDQVLVLISSFATPSTIISLTFLIVELDAVPLIVAVLVLIIAPLECDVIYMLGGCVTAGVTEG